MGGGARSPSPRRAGSMEEPSRRRRQQQPGSNARYRERSYWESRYRDEGAAPAEWFGGLERFREQLEAELKPGDRILVLGEEAPPFPPRRPSFAPPGRGGGVRSDLAGPLPASRRIPVA